MRRALRSFQRDIRGNVAIFSAIFMVVLMGFAALAVDVGKAFVDKRKAQSAADLAAIAAVSDLVNASKAATATVQRNNIATSSPVTVELGTYTADPTIAIANRFQPTSVASANAARVTVQTATPLLFGRVLSGSDSFQIKTQATATQSGFASFVIGSRLASLSNGLLNQTLGSMLGTNLSLTAMDYNSLANVQLDMFDFANALATRAQITGPTYNSVVSSNVSVGSMLNAMSDAGQNAVGATGTSKAALSSVAQSVQGASNKVAVAPLLALGPYSSMPLGQKPKVGVTASALDMVNVAAQIANGQYQVQTAMNLNVAGIAGATLKLAVGQRPQGASWMGVGPAGASAYTAQTRILLTVSLLGSGSIATIQVPIYVQVASASATLNSVSCGFPNVSTSTVTLGVTPAIIDAWIGNVSSSDFGNFSSPPNPPAAALVNTGLLNVTGRAHVTMSNMSPTPVTFSYSDIVQQTKKTVSTQNYTSSLTASLLGNLDLQVNVLGLGLGLPGLLTSQVAGILSAATSPIDQLLYQTLTSLGVGLGQADVWVTGIRCDGAVLVN